MSPDAPDLDHGLCLEALTPGARAAVRRFCRLLGVPEGSWPEIPAVRRYVVTSAVLELADLDAAENVGDAIAAAAHALGLEDDPGRATRPSDSLYRRIRRWRKAADGHAVQPSESEAA